MKFEKDQSKPKVSRMKKQIKVKLGINEIENRNTKEKINKTKTCLQKKLTKL